MRREDDRCASATPAVPTRMAPEAVDAVEDAGGETRARAAPLVAPELVMAIMVTEPPVVGARRGASRACVVRGGT